jgi:tRNA (guanine-N7-)-methyltransferase
MEDLSRQREIFEIKLRSGEKLSFHALFGNSNPVHLEIGSGRGEFLINKAEQLPQVNFLALELKEKRIKTMLRKLDPERHLNVRISRFYVDKNVKEYLPESCFQQIYIIHPDPWPKRKHYKNRLIQASFLPILWGLLDEKGEVFISTDHPGYASWILAHFQNTPLFSSFYQVGFSREKPPDHHETHFEVKKREEGFPPFYMRFVKNNLTQE